MRSEKNDLEKLYSSWSDEDLIRSITLERDDFTEDAITTIEEILRSRDIPSERYDQIKAGILKRDKITNIVRSRSDRIPKTAKLLGLSHFAISFIVVVIVGISPFIGIHSEKEASEVLGWFSFVIWLIMLFLTIVDFPLALIISTMSNNDFMYGISLMIFGTIMWVCIGLLIHKFRPWYRYKKE